MDRGTLLGLLKKHIKAILYALARKLSGKKRRKKALLRAFQATEMGIQVRDVQRVVSHESDSVGPHKPVWAVEKSKRRERLR
jgi:hypothetical protein